MTQNAEIPGVDGRGFQESNAVAREDIVPQLIARPVPVATSGRLEFVARCPNCHVWHRHIGLGQKTGPCGAHYLLKFKGAA
ncbi:MAG TPA: hypothetical protein VI172_05600 [Candidatus Dormibacteraeota bacterium]|jgi:hypothetical protein